MESTSPFISSASSSVTFNSFCSCQFVILPLPSITTLFHYCISSSNRIMLLVPVGLSSRFQNLLRISRVDRFVLAVPGHNRRAATFLVGPAVAPWFCTWDRPPKWSDVLHFTLDTSELVSRCTVASTSQLQISCPSAGVAGSLDPLKDQRSTTRKCRSRFSAITPPHMV